MLGDIGTSQMSKILIDIITKNSVEVIKSAGITKKLEFVDENDNFIPEGVPFHIHITNDKKYYYMTSAQHESTSIIIFRVDGKTPDFVKYKTLRGSQSEEYLQENRTTPLLSDYDIGSIELYFARQANDSGAKIFEISRDDFLKDTPFYTKTSIILEITGDKQTAEQDNQKRIFSANRILPGISEIVSPLQFYKPRKNTKESVQSRLKSYQQAIVGTTSGGSSGGGSGGGGY